ncbi:ABC transporter permease [Flavobacteriales bacterium]|nr:ABC transporter permease [Flavobacteriales bacterium]
MNKIGLIISREYTTRVRKKSFILMSLLGPLLIVGFIMLTAYLKKGNKENYEILVVDESHLFDSILRNSTKYHLQWAPKDKSYDDIQKVFKADEKLDLLVYLPVNLIKTNSMTAKCLYKDIPSTGAQKHLSSIINEAIELYRVTYNKIDISTYKSIKTSINLDVVDIENKANKNIQRKAIVGMVFSIFIYIFIFMYSLQVMRGVIEEKTNRIVEIIISSVSSFQLMMGKIIGVGLVGITQFLIWSLVTTIMSFTVLPRFITDKYNPEFQFSSEEISKNNTLMNTSNEIIQFIIYEIQWPYLIFFFILFFIGGYLLYSGLMAAIGSAVDEEADTQQFLIPLTIPMVFALMMAGKVIDNPSSSLAFWLSEIPFTSPIIMIIRIAMGIGDSSVEIWEIILSLFLLIITFIGTTWISGKIYRKGILSYGKKASYSDIFKWLKL